MDIIKCIHTESYCYQCKGKPGTYPANPVGILVHSTGDKTTELKRYVQPSKDDPDYYELIARIGLNKNKNSWNRNVKKSMHYMVGRDARGVISVAQMLPHDICAWGVANGKKGSYNYKPMYIQFEIQEGLTSDKDFADAWNRAVNLCAMLCLEYGWTEKNITSHYEAHAAGYANGHSDPKGYFAAHGLTMNDFRYAVAEAISPKPPVPPTPTTPIAVGDVVEFSGHQHWSSANAKPEKAKECKPGRAVVKQIYRLGKSKHPYRITGVKGCTANGWVNADEVVKV